MSLVSFFSHQTCSWFLSSSSLPAGKYWPTSKLATTDFINFLYHSCANSLDTRQSRRTNTFNKNFDLLCWKKTRYYWAKYKETQQIIMIFFKVHNLYQGQLMSLFTPGVKTLATQLTAKKNHVWAWSEWQHGCICLTFWHSIKQTTILLSEYFQMSLKCEENTLPLNFPSKSSCVLHFTKYSNWQVEYYYHKHPFSCPSQAESSWDVPPIFPPDAIQFNSTANYLTLLFLFKQDKKWRLVWERYTTVGLSTQDSFEDLSIW